METYIVEGMARVFTKVKARDEDEAMDIAAIGGDKVKFKLCKQPEFEADLATEI